MKETRLRWTPVAVLLAVALSAADMPGLFPEEAVDGAMVDQISEPGDIKAAE